MEVFANVVTFICAFAVLIALTFAARVGDIPLACIMLIALCVILMRWYDVLAQRRRMKFIRHVNEAGR